MYPPFWNLSADSKWQFDMNCDPSPSSTQPERSIPSDGREVSTPDASDSSDTPVVTPDSAPVVSSIVFYVLHPASKKQPARNAAINLLLPIQSISFPKCVHGIIFVSV